MTKYRIFLILILNIPFILSALKAMYIDPLSDTNGIFAGVMFILLAFFDIYAAVIYRMVGNNEEKRIAIEILFILLLLLPFACLGYIFTR